MSKILIIDDEETNVRVLSISLRSDGHDVVTALNGKQGLDVFEKESPDLVLTDIKMPGMDGIEVLRSIKSRNPDAEVIIITGHGDIDNAIEALKLGASDFINKPIRDDVLSLAIERAQQRRTIKQKLQDYTDNLEHEVIKATEEIQRQSNFLQKLIRSSNGGIIATDKDLSIVIFNPGAERIFGYASEDVVKQKKITSLLPAGVQHLFASDHLTAKADAEISWQEIVIQAQDGTEIPVRFYTTALFEIREVMGTVSFFEDLREIKRLEAELMHNERLAAIGQTVAGIAHGVKNVLHGFKGGSYLVNLAISKNDGDMMKKGWDMIQRNIERTSELVLDLLAYSKERPPEYRECSPNALVKDVCEVMQELADENQIRIVTDLDPAISIMAMDASIIHQSLTNLLSNAIDACLFDEDTDKQWQVNVQTRLDGQRYVLFNISDNGTGIDEAVKAKVFNSFFSTKGHRGTGLGLLVTRKLVEEHGGTIEMTSQKDKGTTFTIRLPFKPVD